METNQKKSNRKYKILFLITAVSVCIWGTEYVFFRPENEYHILRKEPGQGSKEEDWTLNAGDILKNYSYHLVVEERKLTKAEAYDYLSWATAELEQEFYREQESAEHVTTQVFPKEEYQGGMVSAEWYFSDYDVISQDGVIVEQQIPETGVLIQATAKLMCSDYTQEYQFVFHVYRADRSKEEKLLGDIADNIKRQQQEMGTDYIELPQEADGNPLVWTRKREYYSLKFIFMGMILYAAATVWKREKKKEEEKKKNDLMELDYPEIISKFTVLMGAGMSAKQAWNRIAMRYVERRNKNLIAIRPAYEEMVKTNREIRDGESERIAYQRFADRTGLPVYRRFVRILLQNMSKGSAGMYALLEQETEAAYLMRKNTARKQGEEAGTKMLFPMMLMLGIVMAIVLVPALLTLNG